MDFDLRLKALSRLAESKTAEADFAIQSETTKAITTLETATDYDSLEQNLKILNVIGHRASETVTSALINLISRLDTIKLTHAQDRLFVEYQNATSLIDEAIDCLLLQRYLNTRNVLNALMDLSLHDSAKVRKKALESLEQLSAYNIDVIYGDGTQSGIGFLPQKIIADQISSLKPDNFRKYFDAILTLGAALLNPMMEKTAWTYNTMTLSRGQVPPSQAISGIRDQAIQFLEGLYPLAANQNEKIRVVSALREATRINQLGQENVDASKIVERNATEVLRFFTIIASGNDHQAIQKVEHEGFWVFYHAVSPAVVEIAHVLETEIAKNAEYQIYKTLIGFEGLFTDWNDLKSKGGHHDLDGDLRKQKALAFASEITPETFPHWRERILKYAETRSDDWATFPVFYYFLEQIALLHPNLALALLTQDAENLSPFLIPLIRTLYGGPKKNAVKALIKQWSHDGKYLYASVKQFTSNEDADYELLAELFLRASKLKDLNVITTVMSVAVSNYRPDRKFLIEEFFLPALRTLTENLDTDWILDFWFRRETRSLIQDLDPQGIDLVLENLLLLKDIDYHAEEILYLIANKAPEKVLDFLIDRLDLRSKQTLSSLAFESIPFEFHKLNKPLSKIPSYAVKAIRTTYVGNYGTFHYLGARLLHIIFPDFPKEFADELINVLASGEKTDIEFVLAVLRNYEGESFIHPVCKEIIRLLPLDSPLLSEAAIALESTGVVSGEFGLAEAYLQKKEEVKDWLIEPDEKIQSFTKKYIETLDRMVAAEKKRAEEEIVLRKHKYGD